MINSTNYIHKNQWTKLRGKKVLGEGNKWLLEVREHISDFHINLVSSTIHWHGFCSSNHVMIFLYFWFQWFSRRLKTQPAKRGLILWINHQVNYPHIFYELIFSNFAHCKWFHESTITNYPQ
jgi:hypothetical protein